MSKHSPIPWRVADERDPEYTGACVLDSQGHLVADCNIFSWGAPSEQECMGNAERIVTAVNTHDDLLEACRKTLQYFTVPIREIPAGEDIGREGLLDLIRATIAKAEPVLNAFAKAQEVAE